MIKEYLNQPYPLQVNKWKLIVSISLFIGLFMLIFKPFGLSQNTGPLKDILCLGYGFVSFIVMVLNIVVIQQLFKNWFDNKRWTVLKQISWLTWIIFSIGLGNFVYTSLFSLRWSFQAFAYFQLFTIAVGIIPIVVLTIIKQNSLLAENLKSAQEFNNSLHTEKQSAENETITLVADNEKDRFVIELSELLYIESTGNYIDVYFFKENRLKSMLLRSTLKRTESQLESHELMIKCHRAFLVNATKIKQVKGNSQGLRLSLKHTETEIPVSRNFARNLKEKLNTFQ